MRRIISLSVVLTLVITSTGLSQDRRRSQQPQQSPFQQVFRLRGVEFTEDQQAQVEELRKKYTPQLAEIVRGNNRVLSDEQRRARQEAFRAARQAGKPPKELKEAVDAAVKLTDEQKETLAKLQKERADLFAEIQKELKALLAQLRQFWPGIRFSESILYPNGVAGRVQFAWVRGEGTVLDVMRVETRCSEDLSA